MRRTLLLAAIVLAAISRASAAVPELPILTVTPVDSGVRLSWQPVAGADSYSVHLFSDGGWLRGIQRGIDGTTYERHDLRNGESYGFGVAAQNESGKEGPLGPTSWVIPPSKVLSSSSAQAASPAPLPPSAGKWRLAEFIDLMTAKFVALTGLELQVGQVVRVYSADLSQGVADFLIDEKTKEGALGHCISIRDDGVVSINAIAMPAGYAPMGTQPVPPLGVKKMMAERGDSVVSGVVLGGLLGGLAGFGIGSPGFLQNQDPNFQIISTLVGLALGALGGGAIGNANADGAVERAITDHPTIPVR